jgi:hypothetical protein
LGFAFEKDKDEKKKKKKKKEARNPYTSQMNRERNNS